MEYIWYDFERNDFCELFRRVFSFGEICNIEVACQEHRLFGYFLLYYNEDDFYIIHLASGIIINWYKHLGRANLHNDEDFTLDDMECLLKDLKKAMEDR